jgi:hypothetical protein
MRRLAETKYWASHAPWEVWLDIGGCKRVLAALLSILFVLRCHSSKSALRRESCVLPRRCKLLAARFNPAHSDGEWKSSRRSFWPSYTDFDYHKDITLLVHEYKPVTLFKMVVLWSLWRYWCELFYQP